MDAAIEPLINVDPEILGGAPVFMGTRVPVKSLTDWLVGGYSLDEFVDEFPTVQRAQAVKLIELAGALILERHSGSALC